MSNMDEHAMHVHNRFMALVSDLIDGSQDSSTYEDTCRLLLGRLSRLYIPVNPGLHCNPFRHVIVRQHGNMKLKCVSQNHKEYWNKQNYSRKLDLAHQC